VASHPLPPEYAALHLTRFRPWTALDSVAVAKLLAFGLSFDLSDIDLTLTLLAYRYLRPTVASTRSTHPSTTRGRPTPTGSPSAAGRPTGS
jgi:acyl-homoserine lactone acylase PvdQ